MSRAAWVTLACALALAGCALFQSDAESLREDVVDEALDQVGEDYEFGGADPDDGFDCSGLVHYVYRQVGIKLPRSAAAQRKAGKFVLFKDAKPGDLLFYDFAGARTPTHVAIYLGDGQAVHAPVDGGEVEVTTVTRPQWTRRYKGAVRIIKD